MSEELGTGEKLLWFGRPNPLRYALQKVWPTMAFGLVLVGMSLQTLLGSTTATQLDSFRFQDGLQIVLILLGLWLALKPVSQFIEAKSVVFFISDRRAGKLFSFPRRRVWSLPKQDLGPYEKQQLSGGLGSIFFSTKVVSDAEGKTFLKQGFVAIADVNEVESILMGIANQNAA